ncbi:MAG TPA: sialidase family protein [Candidatus Lokiarchaeia archaeon]|nr:sialidase family protein [Candidatus Lokiarchaeia archaeon]
MIKTADGITVETITKPVPGLLHHAHCPGIVAFPDGELLVVYYHAIKEGDRKQAIYAVRKTPGDDCWSSPVKIMSHPRMMTGNPAIWIAPDTSKLWLFYVNSIDSWGMCNPRYVTSDDRGQRWSMPRKLYWFISRGIKNPPIMTSNDRYILPAYIEFLDYQGVFYLSDDKGKTWQERGRVKITDNEIPEVVVQTRKKATGKLVLQPTVVERRDGSFWALMRASPPLGKMYQTTSTDGGETWSPAKPYLLPNPNGSFHMMRLQSGNLAIIYNHAPVLDENPWFVPNPLSIALSEDDGVTWTCRRNIVEAHDDHVKQGIGGEPTMTQSADGTIHATWSFSHPGKVNGKIYARSNFNQPEEVYLKHAGFTDINYTSFTEDWIKEHHFFTSVFE